MKTRKLSLMALLFATVVIVAGAWYFSGGGPRSRNIRNVLLISIDTCRSDYLSCYGYGRKTTPNIDALAAEGIRFDNVISPVPLTLPAHSTMLTGTNPPYHGSRDNLNYKLADSNTTLAEVLKENGFATGAIISTFVLDSLFGVDQGFDTYNDKFEEEHFTVGISERKGDETTRLGMKWIEEHKDERFFFFLHYYDPHTGYEPPQPFALRFADNPYAGEIAFTDHCIGKVIAKLRELDLYDSTLIIVVGDHGEMLGEHDEPDHSYYIYQSAIKVPLIFKLPGKNKPRVIEKVVGIIDVTPTICGLLDVELQGPIHGTDLSPYFSKKAYDLDRHIYCESLTPTKYRANSLRGVVTDRWKYIQTTRPEIYDLSKDRYETNDLIKQESQRARILQDSLKEILEEQDRKNDIDNKADIDETSRRRIESIGYVSGSVSDDFDSELDQPKKDPKDMISFHVSVSLVIGLIDKEEYAEAKALCEKLIAEMPDFTNGYVHLSTIAIKQNDHAGAISYLLDALELDSKRFKIHNSLGLSYSYLGEYEKAVRYYKEALRLDPERFEIHNNLGLLYSSLGEYEKAVGYYKEALRLNPEKPRMLSNLALALFKQKKIEEGKVYCLQALEADPELAEAHNNLAIALKIEGKSDEAIKSYEKSLQIDPDQVVVRNELAELLYKQERFGDSIRHYNESLRLDQNQPDVYKFLGSVMLRLDKIEEALESYKKSLDIAPDQPIMHKIAGDILFGQGKTDAAIAHYIGALELKSDMPVVCNSLGEIYFTQGEVAKALEYWGKALALKPDWAAVLNNMAWCKAVYAKAGFYDPDDAIKLAIRANELSDHRNAGFMDTLSVAYAAGGRFLEAIKAVEKAIQLASSAGAKESIEGMKKHLELYKSNKPYYEIQELKTEK